jgi:hypothetical protein
MSANGCKWRKDVLAYRWAEVLLHIYDQQGWSEVIDGVGHVRDPCSKE